ncbi:MAG: outer membrane beta-barrel protein [Bacteroidota bacterium]
MPARLLLLVLLAAPLAAQPGPNAWHADSLGLSAWTRDDGSGPGFDGLPVRDVREVASLLPGVARKLDDGTLFYRSYLGVPLLSRRTVTDFANQTGLFNQSLASVFDRERVGQEPTFVIDGVRVVGEPAVPFEVVERIEVLSGHVPARYGEAAGGLIAIETREGGARYGGRVEGITSEGLDAFGYNLGSFAVHGPLANPQFGRFALSGEVRRLADATPFGIETYRLSDDAYADLLAGPQVVRTVNAQGETRDVPFPWQAAQQAAASGQPFTQSDLRAMLDLPAGFEISERNGLINAPATFTEDRFELERGKDDPLDAFALDGSAVLNLMPALRFRLGATLSRDRLDRTANPARRFRSALYNRDGLDRAERDAGRFYAALDYAPSDRASYQLQVEGQRSSFVQHPRQFSDQVEDALFYGDIDADASEIAQRYFVFRNQQYEPIFTQDGAARPRTVGGTFALPGAPTSIYQKGEGASFRVHGRAALTLGAHRLEVGGEVERQTHRQFVLAGGSLARFFADGSVESTVAGLPEDGVQRYDELPFEALRGVTRVRYGYDFLGLDETDSEDADGYFDRTNPDVAPYRPTYAAGYVQDHVTFGRLALDLGLRVEAFGSNATVLRDPFATVPVVRASALDARPDGIGGDFAVYFDDSGAVVGFRDLDGRFYDAGGEEAFAFTITGERSGQVDLTEEPRSAAFESAPTHVAVQPRLGVRARLSEQATAFAYYGRLARRPAPQLYAPFSVYEEVTGGDAVGNGALRPETVDDIGLGAEGTFAERVRVRGTVFYRRHSDLIEQQILYGGWPEYTTPRNIGSATVYGLDLAGALDRTLGVSLRANYVLSFADGTGAGAASTGTVVWRGLFPATDARSDFDVRHALDLVADYRVGEAFGPVLEGLGLGVVLSAQSGLPYTVLQAPLFNPDDTFTSEAAGDVNAERRPWVAQLDLRLGKAFRIGPSTVDAFLWAENVLGAENVAAVYRATGEPDDDGFLNTPGGGAYLDSQPDRMGGAFNYLAYVGGPVNIGGTQSTGGVFSYGPPRRVWFGLRVTL